MFFNSIVVLTPYHTPTTTTLHFSPTTTPPERIGFIHLLHTFFWMVAVTDTDISWVNLSTPLLPKHILFVALNSITWNTHNK